MSDEPKLRYQLKWGDPDRRLAELALERGARPSLWTSVVLFMLIFGFIFSISLYILA